jgi:hypothetical protein
MAGKSKVGVGELIDTAGYGPATQYGEFVQPFWDLELLRDDGFTPADPEGSPLYSDNPWDSVQLGAYMLPGIWTASATPAIKLDIQAPKGFDGAALISRGYLPAGITLTGLLWTIRQWYTLQQIFPTIWARPHKKGDQDVVKVSAQSVVLGKGGKVSAVQKDPGLIVGQQQSLTVVNPALNFLGITALVIERPTPPTRHSIPGVMQMTFQCIEYVAEPPAAKSSVKSVKGQTSRGKNAFDKAIEEKDARNPKAPSRTKKALEP